MGRPSDYSEELTDEICEKLAAGESLRAICSLEEFPAERTVYYWLESKPDFLQKYARAREQQADYYVAQIVDIADKTQLGEIVTLKADGSEERKIADMIEHRRLQVDARKWAASKLAPKKYGDKQQLEVPGLVDLAGELAEARKRLHGV